MVGATRYGAVASSVVARLNPNGTPDSSFGVNGLVDPLVDNAGGGSSAIALFGDSADRLYVLNTRVLTRLSPNGAVDDTFGRFPSNSRLSTRPPSSIPDGAAPRWSTAVSAHYCWAAWISRGW